MPAIEGVTNDIVLEALFARMPEDERAILCSVKGNPSEADPTAWVGTPWKRGTKCPLDPRRNNYVAISSFRADENGKYRRRKSQFGQTWALMIDDIGTKLPLSAVPRELVPSLVVESSPGNYQATFFLDQPLQHEALVSDGIRQIIAKLTNGGVDPGMAGVTRVLRLPEGVNGKPNYIRDGQVWRCKVWVWRPDIRTTWDELRQAFGVIERVKVYTEPNDGVTLERKRCFGLVKQGLKHLGLIKHATGSGWMDITCPWIEQHTGRANTGTAVAPPMKANGYMGGFKCHHGHCEQRNWGDLEEWVAREVVMRGRRTRGPFYGANQ